MLKIVFIEYDWIVTICYNLQNSGTKKEAPKSRMAPLNNQMQFWSLSTANPCEELKPSRGARFCEEESAQEMVPQSQGTD